MSAYLSEISSSARNAASAPINAPIANEQKSEDAIPVDGYQQVLEMLRVADPQFRESLLKRIAARDRNLALDLRRQIGT